MLRYIKNIFLILLMFISVIGLLMSIAIYLVILTMSENILPKGIFGVLFAIPIVFIPAVGISIAKTVKYKGKEYKYGIRFWPAIANAPDFFAIIIYVLAINLVVVIMFYSNDYCEDSLVLSSGMILFYYMSTLIYASTIKG